MENIKSLTFTELEREMTALGQPAFRAGQVFQWLHRGVASFDEMTNLSRSLREELAARWAIAPPHIAARQQSKDGTVKYLFAFPDGNAVESVLMRYEHGYSICISTQAGCKMGCVFCASYDPSRTRNLTPAEMLDQVLLAGKDAGVRISNIVLMGTGEPLDNYDNVLAFLDIVSHEKGLIIGMRHISLSTCGLVPGIDRLAGEELQLTLSISLHAPTDALRSRLMPINRKYPLEALMAACRRYYEKTSRRISFEYAMIGGVNDTEECARALARLLKGTGSHVNLIPLNRVEGSPLAPSSKERIRSFQSFLVQNGVNTTVRRSLGGDIAAACGQLSRRVGNGSDKKKEVNR